jgi:glycosyltransferase involved in cell wall biosynthesis
MKRVAIVYERELDLGGVETHLLALLKRVDPAQYQLVFFSPASARFQAQVESKGGQLIRLTTFAPLTPGIQARLRRGFGELGIDLVHAHSPTAAVPARLAAARLNLPALVTVHIPAIDYHGRLHTLRASSGRILYTALDRLLNFRLTARLVYVSQFIHQREVAHQRTPASRSQVIPNGIDLERFQPLLAERARLRQAYGLAEDLPLVVFAGRLSDQKGLDVLLEALRLVKGQRSAPFATWLVGNGPLEASLRTQAQQSGLDEQVRFLGVQQDIPAYLSAGDLFVLPSRWEAMSIALLEALACGLPCVVSRVGDNPLLVEDGREGLTTPPEQAGPLAAALLRLLDDPELRARMSGLARARAAQFDEIKMAKQLQAVYEELL